MWFDDLLDTHNQRLAHLGPDYGQPHSSRVSIPTRSRRVEVLRLQARALLTTRPPSRRG